MNSATNLKHKQQSFKAHMYNRRLPAEWEPQSGVMLVWPHAHGDWKHNLDEVEETYAEIVSAICAYEIALIICYDDAHRAHIKQRLNSHHHIQSTSAYNNLQFVIAPSNDSWVRDTGPITTTESTVESSSKNKTYSKSLCLHNFTFNGWGEKFPWILDNDITSHLKQARTFGQHPVCDHSLILEGGSIESDGQGTLLTTTSCLSNPNRNPSLSSKDIENILQTQLGAKRILWLKNGRLTGDDTDGHIDTLARFCSHDTIAYTHCNDSTDAHFKELANMAKELASLKTTEGMPYRLLPLPIPSAIYNSQGDRLPANYTNFLIINDAVLIPTYNDPNDIVSIQALETCFPGRKIIGIDCRSLLQQFGSLHCATMQLPFGILN